MRRQAILIVVLTMGLSGCSSASAEPELAAFCERALETARLNYAATHYEGTDQEELRELMAEAAEASGRYFDGDAPQAISDEWETIREYESDLTRNLDETYFAAYFVVRGYAGSNCDGLSLGSDGSLQLDQSR